MIGGDRRGCVSELVCPPLLPMNKKRAQRVGDACLHLSAATPPAASWDVAWMGGCQTNIPRKCWKLPAKSQLLKARDAGAGEVVVRWKEGISVSHPPRVNGRGANENSAIDSGRRRRSTAVVAVLGLSIQAIPRER